MQRCNWQLFIPILCLIQTRTNQFRVSNDEVSHDRLMTNRSKTSLLSHQIIGINHALTFAEDKLNSQPRASHVRVLRSTPPKQVETSESSNVEAVVNSTALLPCRPFKKSPEDSAWNEGTKGTLLWKRLNTNDYLIHDNRRLHPDTRYILDMSSFDQTIMDLRIDHVQITDEGEYLCLYSTGQNVYKRRNTLKVLVPPLIYENSSSPVRVVVQEGDTTVLHCKAWGVPEPTLTWHSIPQDGPPRPISLTLDSRFSVEPNQLTISNVSRKLHGLYKCFATNGLQQTASRIIELDVQFPPIIKMANQKIGQSIHRTTMVRALIKGNPINAFYWEFERRPIHGPNSNCLIPMPNEKYCVSVDKISEVQKEVKTTLFISNLTNEDYGFYTCVVETPFGIFRNSTEVFRTHPVSLSPWDKYAHNPVQESDSRILSNTDIVSRNMNEKMKKRATYLTVNAPYPEHSHRLDSLNSGSCLRGTCNQRNAFIFAQTSTMLVLICSCLNVVIVSKCSL